MVYLEVRNGASLHPTTETEGERGGETETIREVARRQPDNHSKQRTGIQSTLQRRGRDLPWQNREREKKSSTDTTQRERGNVELEHTGGPIMVLER